jgi:hypothetical protein
MTGGCAIAVRSRVVEVGVDDEARVEIVPEHLPDLIGLRRRRDQVETEACRPLELTSSRMWPRRVSQRERAPV